MALAVVLDWVVGAELITLLDATGAYSGSNTGGYGSPNAEFTDYAHYAIIRKMGVNGTEDAVLTIEAYDPDEALTFIAPRAVDGWYEGKKLNITKWSAGSLDEDTVREHEGTVYLSNDSTSSEPGTDGTWDEVTDMTEIEDNETVLVTTKGISTPYNGDVYWSKQIAANSQQGRCGICEDDRQKKRLDEIKMHIYATNAASVFENYSDGEWNALALQTMGAR